MAAVEAIPADLAVIHRPVQQGHAVLGAGLGEDIADVVVDRSLADHQLKGDFLIGQARRDPLDDFQLAFRKIGAQLDVIVSIGHPDSTPPRFHCKQRPLTHDGP